MCFPYASSQETSVKACITNAIFALQSTGQGMEVKLKTGLVSTHAYSINNVVAVRCDNFIFP